jgi:hypothetical protein
MGNGMFERKMDMIVTVRDKYPNIALPIVPVNDPVRSTYIG